MSPVLPPDSGDQLDQVKIEFAALRATTRRFLFGFLQYVQIFVEAVICYLSFGFWLYRYRITMRLAVWGVRVFLFVGVFELIEKLVKIVAGMHSAKLAHFLASHPHLHVVARGALRLLENPSTDIFLAIVGMLVIYHHWREPAHHHHEVAVLAVIRIILEPINQLNIALSNSTPAQRPALEKEYWDVLSHAIMSLFLQRHIKDLDVCIMRWNAGTARLEIAYESGEVRRFSHEITFASGEGAAGIAYERNLPIYLPNIHNRHGVFLVQEEEALGMRPIFNAYKPVPNDFKSIVAIPIRYDSANANGVVNLSSKRKGPFRGNDFHVALLMGVILGLIERP